MQDMNVPRLQQSFGTGLYDRISPLEYRIQEIFDICIDERQFLNHVQKGEICDVLAGAQFDSLLLNPTWFDSSDVSFGHKTSDITSVFKLMFSHRDVLSCPTNDELEIRDRLTQEIDCILDHFKINLKGKRVIDVGCRSGENTISMIQQGANVIGIDPDDSEFNVAVSKGMPVDNLFKATLQQYRVDHPDQQFDIATVFLWNVYHSKRESFVASLAEVIKPGGIAVVSYYDEEYDQGSSSVKDLLESVFDEVDSAEFDTWNRVALLCKKHL